MVHESRWIGYGRAVRHLPNDRRSPLRVALLHESELVRRGLAAVLEPYASRVTLLPPADQRPDRPDLALTGAGPALTELALGRHRDRVVVHTWNTRCDVVDGVLRAGARGCLSTDLPTPSLVAALEAIARGERVVRLGIGADPADSAERLGLSPREAQLMTLLTQGMDNLGIAREANLSVNSVKSYLRSAYARIGVSSRSQAVLWGIRHGCLPLGDPATALVGPAEPVTSVGGHRAA